MHLHALVNLSVKYTQDDGFLASYLPMLFYASLDLIHDVGGHVLLEGKVGVTVQRGKVPAAKKFDFPASYRGLLKDNPARADEIGLASACLFSMPEKSHSFFHLPSLSLDRALRNIGLSWRERTLCLNL